MLWGATRGGQYIPQAPIYCITNTRVLTTSSQAMGQPRQEPALFNHELN